MASIKRRNLLLFLATPLYYKAFRRNTLDPVQRITEMFNRDEDVRDEYAAFCRVKSRENNYVQAAGIVMFASTIGTLSWDSIAHPDVHWSAPCLMYASITFALLAMIAGAQQSWILPDEPTNVTGEMLKEHLVKPTPTGKYRINWSLVFAFQSPLMLVTYSIMMFLTGLWSVVFSPLRSSHGWDDPAKIATLFAASNLVAFVIFCGCSYVIHSLPEPLIYRREPSMNEKAQPSQRVSGEESVPVQDQD